MALLPAIGVLPDIRPQAYDGSRRSEAKMRTKVDVEATLLERAMKATGGKSEMDTVEAALRAVIERGERRQALENLRGAGWNGNLDEIREGWNG
jgi:Arc/MetJ family transcription regulator